MKKFLLLAGQDYYPGAGTDNWIGCYDTYEEAEAQIIVKTTKYVDREIQNYYLSESESVDWYEIVDLEEWMNI